MGVKDYSVSGAFGEVKIFPVRVPLSHFRSVDSIIHCGWHRVNDLYKIRHDEGRDINLLLLTRGGHGEVCIGEERYAATEGSAFLIPKGVSNSYRTQPGREWEFNWVYYRGEAAELRTADILEGGVRRQLGRGVIELLFSELERDSAHMSELALSDSLERILGALLGQEGVSDSEEVGRILRGIEDYGAEFTLSGLAERFHYSREYLIRLVKKRTGLTPYAYWRRARLRRSCDELIKGERTIGEIARQFGYASVNSYTNQFASYYKMPPGKYRRTYGLH